MSNQKILKE